MASRAGDIERETFAGDIERETFAGDIERRNVPAPVAVWMVLYDPALGDVYCRGVVQWGDVIDRWSGSV